ncbi:unnamed protein product [Mucor circinelloides]|uniref:Ras-GEF domain-containing protein n=1 Tax=Mucor circinelloides f. circinelloides (strain 1006PhL) TaxID=1220926 RepID=S2K589_MUCC1|nr:hypothetical protein HMPREF1544_05880 [Mucor circinelloides 1006PhL]
MASIANHQKDTNSGLPVIPLSPIAQSYIICSNALNLATEKLTEAKKANPPVQVGVLRGFLETSKVEAHRLNSLTRKMQSVEAATALFWDSDALARQIAVIDCQLYGNAFLDKRSLSQLDKEQTKLVHLVDFHHYLSHSVAHQLIYWAELVSNSELAAEVVPPVHPTKDSLVTHFVRVAYLLLHAYRDFSGFAAIIKALTFPEVRRLNKKLWHNCSSRTKDMFRELANMVSPSKNYAAYQVALRSKLELYVQGHGSMMIAVPWIQPHLLSIRSIVTAYTAGDNEDHLSLGDIVLSAPGAQKLDMELSILELCQHNNCTSDFSLEDILSTGGLFQTKSSSKRASMATSATKAIHIEGLRAAVIPVANLNHLAPGEQLTHHWLVSRVYLRKDQLINESIEVEPLKAGETIACDSDEFEETRFVQPAVSRATSRRTSFVPLEQEQDQYIEQELVDMSVKTVPSLQVAADANHTDDEDEDDNSGEGGLETTIKATESNEPANTPLAGPVQEVIVEHEVTPPPVATETTVAHVQEEETPAAVVPEPSQPTKADEDDHVEIIVEQDQELQEMDPLSVELQDVELKQVELKEMELQPIEPAAVEMQDVDPQQVELKETDKPVDNVEEKVQDEQALPSNRQNQERLKSDTNETKATLAPSSVSSSNSTSASKQKSRLSPTAPEFVPSSNYSQAKKTESVVTSTTDEKWCGYPIREEDEVATLTTNTESEKWVGYPAPVDKQVLEQHGEEEEEDDDEVWKGYPGPNSSTDSPRRASSQSETSEEWKGYQATKMEATWQRESALKVQEHEWQGYALETLDEDELDSSTMMDGEFEKSRQARGQKQHGKKMNF